MPPKKAAKKSSAKHADPKHHDRPKHHQQKDLRRAYEHLGRVEALQPNVDKATSKDIRTLVALAEKELGSGHQKDAADLLRAAEHFSFAALADTGGKPGKVSPELKDAVHAEAEHLTRKAREHWDKGEPAEHHAAVTPLFHNSLASVEKALAAGAYRQALELSRAAEALARVKQHGPEQLEDTAKQAKLPKP